MERRRGRALSGLEGRRCQLPGAAMGPGHGPMQHDQCHAAGGRDGFDRGSGPTWRDASDRPFNRVNAIFTKCAEGDIPRKQRPMARDVTSGSIAYCAKRTEAPEAALAPNKASGTYRCRRCGARCLGSDTKYDSGSGGRVHARSKAKPGDAIKDSSHGWSVQKCAARRAKASVMSSPMARRRGLALCINSDSRLRRRRGRRRHEQGAAPGTTALEALVAGGSAIGRWPNGSVP